MPESLAVSELWTLVLGHTAFVHWTDVPSCWLDLTKNVFGTAYLSMAVSQLTLPAAGPKVASCILWFGLTWVSTQ